MPERTAEANNADIIKKAKRSIRKNLLIILIALLFFIPSTAFASKTVSANMPSPTVTEAPAENPAATEAPVTDDLSAQTQAQPQTDTPPEQTQAVGDPGQGTEGAGGAGGTGTGGTGNGGLGETLGDNPELNELFDALNITSDTTTIDLIILITILTIAPSLLIMLTGFTRIIIAFSLLRNAMGIAMTPPNQVMIGLALFMTFFIMTPVFSQMNEVAYVPYKAGEISSTEALSRASDPLKAWMLRNTSNESMDFFIAMSNEPELTNLNEEEFLSQVRFSTVVPAFILSEIKIGFQIGFLLYVPFLIIDIVVATILMSMGMMMLPPTTVSIPFKILLFVLVDGWTLLIESLVTGFNSG
ncbi:MAG: flagellar type III secretion system pore protein FliP [Ruminococcus sp.]|jgi:flagellar biosynthetic protein FliP|nr:flagellar type III secretion system pore protein FliP [Ruminococcus sp.]